MATHSPSPHELATPQTAPAIMPPETAIPNKAPPAHFAARDEHRVQAGVHLLRGASAVLHAQMIHDCLPGDAVAEEGVRALYAAQIGVTHQEAPKEDARDIIATLTPAHSLSTKSSTASSRASPSKAKDASASGESNASDMRTVTDSVASGASPEEVPDGDNDEDELQPSTDTPAPQAGAPADEARKVMPAILSSLSSSTPRQATGANAGIQGPISFARATRRSAEEQADAGGARGGAESGGKVSGAANSGAAHLSHAQNEGGASSSHSNGGGSNGARGGGGRGNEVGGGAYSQQSASRQPGDARRLRTVHRKLKLISPIVRRIGPASTKLQTHFMEALAEAHREIDRTTNEAHGNLGNESAEHGGS